MVRKLTKKRIDDTFLWEEYVRTCMYLLINFIFDTNEPQHEYNIEGVKDEISSVCRFFIKTCQRQLESSSLKKKKEVKQIGATYTMLLIHM